MKGLTRNFNTWLELMWLLTGLGLFLAWTGTDAACKLTPKTLWSDVVPQAENFTDKHSNKVRTCMWNVRAALEGYSVHVSFDVLKLRPSAEDDDTGDCIHILDVAESDQNMTLDILCGGGNPPKKSYVGSGRMLRLVYTRGEEEGDRRFRVIYWSQPGNFQSTLTPTESESTVSSYTSLEMHGRATTSSPATQTSLLPASQSTSGLHPSLSKISTEQIIRVVGIFGAVIVGAIVIFAVLKFTKCCRCLRRKDQTTAGHQSTGSLGERAGLAAGMRRQGRVVVNTQNATFDPEGSSQPLSPVVLSAASGNNFNNVSVHPADSAAPEAEIDSDSGSLHEMNELPPSYESLYLNEFGEPATPPKYSPPAHRSTHPPRRVHTFN